MSNQQANVIVHVSGAVGATQRAEIERAVAAQPGVARAAMSPVSERLILVDYDPFATSSQRILQTIRASGVTAGLIGM